MKDYPFAVLLLLAACGEPQAADSRLPEVWIAGPATVAPLDTVHLVASANDAVSGVIPDASLHWVVDDTLEFEGHSIAVRAPLEGQIEIRLIVEGEAGVLAEARHWVRVKKPGALIWQRLVDAEVLFPSLAYDARTRTIYLGSSRGLFSIQRTPAIKWSMSQPIRGESITLAADGVVYAPLERTLEALRPTGLPAWSDSMIAREILVTHSGDVVVVLGTGIRTLGPDGTPRGSVISGTASSVAADREGRRWFAMGIEARAYDQNGSQLRRILWIPAGCNIRDVVPGAGNTVILLGSGFVAGVIQSCVNVVYAGTTGVVWSRAWTEFAIQAPPAVASDGTLYFSFSDGSLLAIGSNGVDQWRTPPIVADCDRLYTVNAPAIGADGMIFHHAAGRLAAVSPSGEVHWSAETTRPGTAESCHYAHAPMLTSDGWVVTLTGGNWLSAFAAGTVADPAAPWGQHLADERRSRQGR